MDLELEEFYKIIKLKFSVIAKGDKVGWGNIEHY